MTEAKLESHGGIQEICGAASSMGRRTSAQHRSDGGEDTDEIVQFPNNLPPATKIDQMTRDHLPITPQDGLVIDELNDVVSDGEPITLRRYRVTNASDRLPLLLYIHGGGFVTGGLETDDYMCREIALKVPVVVLSVKYRLAPEHPFPAGFEDCFEVIRWASRLKYTCMDASY